MKGKFKARQVFQAAGFWGCRKQATHSGHLVRGMGTPQHLSGRSWEELLGVTQHSRHSSQLSMLLSSTCHVFRHWATLTHIILSIGNTPVDESHFFMEPGYLTGLRPPYVPLIIQSLFQPVWFRVRWCHIQAASSSEYEAMGMTDTYETHDLIMTPSYHKWQYLF